MMLRITELHAGYGDLTVVRGVSLSVAAGEIVALLGHNGVGKTTLLRAIMGLIRPGGGEITLAGRSLLGLKPHAVAAKGIAYIPQEAALFPDLSVAQNLRVAFGGRAGFDTACDRALQSFPFLRERFWQRAGTLSGGEQKMLLVARALLVAPKLMLADEVTEGVQPTQVERISDVLRTLNKSEGTAMLLVEQHVAFAIGLAQRFVVMKQGAIAAAGDAAAPAAQAEIESQLASALLATGQS
jgi:ABC-type branched-subunit amino acid transport system ATPase component